MVSMLLSDRRPVSAPIALLRSPESVAAPKAKGVLTAML